LVEYRLASDVEHVCGRFVVGWPGSAELIARVEPRAKGFVNESVRVEPPVQYYLPEFPYFIGWSRLVEVEPVRLTADRAGFAFEKSFIDIDAVGLAHVG